jgi:hypothetical protein
MDTIRTAWSMLMVSPSTPRSNGASYGRRVAGLKPRLTRGIKRLLTRVEVPEHQSAEPATVIQVTRDEIAQECATTSSLT